MEPTTPAFDSIADPACRSFYEDASGYHGEADRVLLPRDVQELREIVGHCSANEIPLTVAGAGTGLTGARVPHGGWVVSLGRFRRLDVKRGSAWCGAGLPVRDLQERAAQTRQFLGPNPTENSASVGGVISTNAGGARSFHYGAMRRHVLSLEVTFMDGATVVYHRGDRADFPYNPVRQPSTTKNAAGYYLVPDLDWVQLLTGSEGTLGIITEAELQLVDEPEAILSGVVFFASDEQALLAVRAWRNIPELRLLEFMDAAALALLRPQFGEIPEMAGAALLIEQNLSSEEDDQVDLWTDRLEMPGALEAESWFGFRASDRERFRVFRHALPTAAVERGRRGGYSKFSTDFAVPLEYDLEVYHFTKDLCERVLPGRYTIFGHAGDANNHLNAFPVSREEAAQVEAMMLELARYVVSVGGSVAAEHGIGKSKTDLLRMMYTPEEIAAMRSVKKYLDPLFLLGRGSIFS